MVRGPTPSLMQDVMHDLRRERTGEVFTEVLGESTHVAGSVDVHQPIFIHRKHSKTAKQIIDITAEFAQRTA